MSNAWKPIQLTTVQEVLDILAELHDKRWLSRGQSKRYDRLLPSIERESRENLPRLQKLKLERQAIDIFRSTAQFFTSQGEQAALFDDIIALMVLRHYGVPTRLLDWSHSPNVAAYFAACNNDNEDGEIWSFDEPEYEQAGKKQWKRWPETTSDFSGDSDKFKPELTAFTLEEPPNWFVCQFYTEGFPRQQAQSGAFTMTARFNRDHDEAIAELLGEESRYHLYVVDAAIKPELRRAIHEKHGIWRGSLYPDSAGAAETANSVFSNSSV